MNEAGPNDRVLNLTVSMFQDASTPYFHQSVGGYHGAKMRRYQDLIETGIMDNVNTLFAALQTQNYRKVDSTLAHANTLNMLNTRYIIINPETQPIVNRHAMGNAWFVQQVKVVEDADRDIAALGSLDLEREATLDERYAGQIPTSFGEDPSASIELVDYQPNRMVYRSRSAAEQLAVFSEIHYERGWQATIDGENVDHYRVNYTLRGLVVPSGEHEIVFEFRPRAYYAGSVISTVSSVLLLLLLAGAIYLNYRNGKFESKPLIGV
jgi:hypothetical protein